MSNPDRPLPGERYDPRYDADPNVNPVPAGRGPVISGKVADGQGRAEYKGARVAPRDPPYSFTKVCLDDAVEALTEMAKPSAGRGGLGCGTDHGQEYKVKPVPAPPRPRPRDSELFDNQLNLDKLLERVMTPWGSWAVLFEGKRYKVKRLVVLPGKQTSLQSHLHRQETWVVVHGTAEVINADPRETHDMDDEDLDKALTPFLLEEGSSEYIARCSLHRLGNPGRVPLIVIETQYGSYLSEDDILRIDTSANIPNYYKPLLETEPVDEQE